MWESFVSADNVLWEYERLEEPKKELMKPHLWDVLTQAAKTAVVGGAEIISRSKCNQKCISLTRPRMRLGGGTQKLKTEGLWPTAVAYAQFLN